MDSVDLKTLDSNLFKARKQVEDFLCDLPALKQVKISYFFSKDISKSNKLWFKKGCKSA